MSENKTENVYVTLSVKLLLISAAVVLLLAAANFLTKDIIAANNAAKTDAAMHELFSEGSFEPMAYTMTSEESKYVSDIYTVKKDDYIIGYCFAVKSAGFGGDISMIIGITSASKIAGVRIISHSETPSIGASAISGDGLLPQFNSMQTSDTDSVVGVSGATVTSTAVSAGVKAAAKLADRIISENG